jgi:hypothetical protein
MRDRRVFAVALAVAMAAVPARADVWDVQADNDNGNTTQNELVHGSDQIHDLGALAGPAADQDWYGIHQKAYSSYEVVVDATSGDLGTGLALDRVDSGGTVLSTSTSSGVGFSRSLRFANTTAVPNGGEFVRVTASCGTNCTASDQYRIRAYETTFAVPRFNNAGSQVTVLVVQNPGDATVTGTVYFWNTGGTLLGSAPLSLAAKETLVLNTATVAGVAGQSGAITVAHDAGYSGLAGKAVALEPSTGFSFDTPMVARSH